MIIKKCGNFLDKDNEMTLIVILMNLTKDGCTILQIKRNIKIARKIRVTVKMKI